MRLFANQSSLQFSSVSAKIVNKDNIRVFKTVRLFKSLLCIGNAAAAAKKNGCISLAVSAQFNTSYDCGLLGFLRVQFLV